ncbi:MAG TPA: tetraacyldisaccharide 4'-kinase [Terriglobia bacterium]
MSRAFGLLVKARARLYESGILPTRRLSYPVISVGNLTLGGTGKTPIVIAIAEQLRDRGFRPVILSRGYRRVSRGIVIAESDWEQCGDEPMLMKQRLGNVPVVVGADRYEAGLVAQQKQSGNIFILDDGFQHRHLHRDFDIVSIDPIEWAEGEALLPAGRWREPKSAIARAHAACVQEIEGVPGPDLSVPTFAVRTEIEGIYKDGAEVPVATLNGRRIVAFGGIAKPERFFMAVRSMGIQPAECVHFADHHRYSTRELEKLGGELLLTTEKDAVRLHGLTSRPFCYLRISAKIRAFEELMGLILRKCFTGR